MNRLALNFSTQTAGLSVPVTACRNHAAKRNSTIEVFLGLFGLELALTPERASMMVVLLAGSPLANARTTPCCRFVLSFVTNGQEVLPLFREEKQGVDHKGHADAPAGLLAVFERRVAIKGDIQRPLVTLKLQADALINPQGAFGVLGYRNNCSGNVFAIVFAFGRRREDALGG